MALSADLRRDILAIANKRREIVYGPTRREQIELSAFEKFVEFLNLYAAAAAAKTDQQDAILEDDVCRNLLVRIIASETYREPILRKLVEKDKEGATHAFNVNLEAAFKVTKLEKRAAHYIPHLLHTELAPNLGSRQITLSASAINSFYKDICTALGEKVDDTTLIQALYINYAASPPVPAPSAPAQVAAVAPSVSQTAVTPQVAAATAVVVAASLAAQDKSASTPAPTAPQLTPNITTMVVGKGDFTTIAADHGRGVPRSMHSVLAKVEEPAPRLEKVQAGFENEAVQEVVNEERSTAIAAALSKVCDQAIHLPVGRNPHYRERILLNNLIERLQQSFYLVRSDVAARIYFDDVNETRLISALKDMKNYLTEYDNVDDFNNFAEQLNQMILQVWGADKDVARERARDFIGFSVDFSKGITSAEKEVTAKEIKRFNDIVFKILTAVGTLLGLLVGLAIAVKTGGLAWIAVPACAVGGGVLAGGISKALANRGFFGGAEPDTRFEVATTKINESLTDIFALPKPSGK